MSLNLPDSVHEACKALVEQGPWSGSMEERKAKFQAFVIRASQDFLGEEDSPIAVAEKAPEVVFENVRADAPSGSSSSSSFSRDSHKITIRNKASVVALFIHFNEAAGSGRGYHLAQDMFREYFPAQAARQ